MITRQWRVQLSTGEERFIVGLFGDEKAVLRWNNGAAVGVGPGQYGRD